MTPAHALVHGLEPQGETCQYSKSPPAILSNEIVLSLFLLISVLGIVLPIS